MLTSIDVKFIFDSANNNRKILPNLVTSSLLWWIMRVLLANQNQGNTYLFIVRKNALKIRNCAY